MAGQKTDERDKQLGQRIVEHRKNARLTQRTVAESFGMSAAQLQKYEKGTNRISAIHLAILSRLTGVPLVNFLDGIPQIDNVTDHGFAEKRQESYAADDPWSGLALVVARHVSDHFGAESRKEFTAAVDTLSRELKK